MFKNNELLIQFLVVTTDETPSALIIDMNGCGFFCVSKMCLLARPVQPGPFIVLRYCCFSPKLRVSVDIRP